VFGKVGRPHHVGVGETSRYEQGCVAHLAQELKVFLLAFLHRKKSSPFSEEKEAKRLLLPAPLERGA
jgi:hypothetical protein